MSLLDGVRHRLYVLTRGEAYSREVEREMRFHLELDRLPLANGERDAELVARRNFGNVTYYREEVRNVSPLQWIDRIQQDASYAWRGLWRTPGFTATVILTLGLGLGVNAAMYSFLDQIFVRPPAGVVAPEGVRRVYFRSSRGTTVSGSGIFSSFSYSRFRALREHAAASGQLAAFTPSGGGLLAGAGVSDSARVSYVSGDFFSVLRMRPALGRLLVAEEARVEVETPVAVISYALWQRAFAADPGVLGRVVRIRDKQVTVVGVAARGFSGVETNMVDIWLPLNCYPIPPTNGKPWYLGTGNFLRAVARIDSAAAETRLIAAGTAALRNNPYDARPDSTFTLLTGPINEARGPADLAREVSLSMRLAGVAIIVLIIACANVATLLLLRAASRRREIAVRRALGVSRARLYGQLLTESVVLGVISGGAAALFALWGGAALRKLVLPSVHWSGGAVDWKILIGTIGVGVLAGLLAGIFPAVGSTSPELSSALKAGARSEGYRNPKSQSALLVTQAALSVVLLVGAGLFVRSLGNVASIDLGYEPDGLIITNNYLFRDPVRARVVGAELVDVATRLRSLPGVAAVATSSVAPMAGYATGGVYLPGSDSALRIAGQYPTYVIASPEFFDAAGTRILAGRGFTQADRVGNPAVVVVAQQMARSLWPSENPIGQCLIIGKPVNGCTRVVGVVEDVNRSTIIERVGSQYYLPFAQDPEKTAESLVIRARPDQVPLVIAAVRSELAKLMPNPADFDVRSMAQLLEPQLRPWRLGAILFSSLGLLALAVVAVGIYGVVAYGVTQRMHEMGVRIALGAQMRDVLDLVLGEGLRVVAIGVTIGIVAALLLGRLVSSLLFGVVPSDPSVLLVAVVTICALTGIATVIPGLRAARVDPVTALRAE